MIEGANDKGREMGQRILYLGAVDGLKPKLDGVRRYAALRGWEVVPVSSVGLPYAGIPAVLERIRPDGCVVGCNGGDYFPPKRLFGAVPVIYLDLPARIPGASSCWIVSVDDDAVVQTAFRELEGWHPESVGAVEARENWPWSRFRARAFRAAAASRSLPCAVFAARRGEPFDAYFARLRTWLRSRRRPCGVFAVNDETASFVIRACREEFLHIPKDIAIVGADDADIQGHDENPLSSVRIDFANAGFLAAKMLGDAISHRGTETRRNIKQQYPRENSIQGNFLCGSVAPCDKKHFTVGPLMVVRRKSTSGRGRQIPCMDAALSIIRHEACDGLTARALAARFPGTRRHFDRRFREATGHSVLDEILHVRMESAFRLLAGTDVPVGAVADFCGFGCYQELDRLFRSRCGMSMSEWRRRNAANGAK